MHTPRAYPEHVVDCRLAAGRRIRGRSSAAATHPLAAVIGALLLLSSLHGDAARADTIVIDVDDDQTATVVGRSDSLKRVVAELCERGGVRLVAYEASDREIAVHYPDLPLKDLLPRLLKQESFVVGLRTVGSRSASLVSTLRVIGDKTGNGTYAIIPPEEREALGDAMSGAAAVRDPAPDFEIPADVLSSGFQSDSPTDHEEAARYISEDMLGDEGSRRRFVAADGEVIANQLRRYQHSANILAIVRNRQADAAVIAKLNEIIVDVRRDR